MKNIFLVYNGKEELTKKYDNNSIKDLFPDLAIRLIVKSSENANDIENEAISIKLDINIPYTIKKVYVKSVLTKVIKIL